MEAMSEAERFGAVPRDIPDWLMQALVRQIEEQSGVSHEHKKSPASEETGL